MGCLSSVKHTCKYPGLVLNLIMFRPFSGALRILGDAITMIIPMLSTGMAHESLKDCIWVTGRKQWPTTQGLSRALQEKYQNGLIMLTHIHMIIHITHVLACMWVCLKMGWNHRRHQHQHHVVFRLIWCWNTTHPRDFYRGITTRNPFVWCLHIFKKPSSW